MAAFTAGDLVVYRVGDGAAADTLSSAATSVFLDEINPTTGAIVQTIALPTADNGSTHAFTDSGTATSDGLLTTSADGRYLVLAGYDSPPGTSSLTSTSARTIARVGADGTVDTSTTYADTGASNNIRGAASPDGSTFYFTTASSGVREEAYGATASTQLSTTLTNLRGVEIAGGQLYVSTGSGSAIRIGAVGSGEPTASGQIITTLPGVPVSSSSGTLVYSPYQFFLAHTGATGTAPDTLYVADDTVGGGEVAKFSLVSGAWTANGVVADPSVRGITGVVSGSTVTLYTSTGGSASTGGGTVRQIVDTAGYNAAITGMASTIYTAPTNEAFRGVALAPAGTAPAPAAPTLTSSTPAENMTGVAPGANLVLNFSEGVKAGAGNFVLTDVATGAAVTIAAADTTQVTFNGTTVTINPAADLNAGDTYRLSAGATAVTDTTGATAYAGGADVLDFATATAPGPIPGGPQAQTYAITGPGTYQLAAGQTFTETGAATAITATDTASAQTAVDIEGAVVGAAAQKGLVETVPNGLLTVGVLGSIHTTDADAFQFVQPTGGGGHANVINLGAIVSASTIGTPVTSGGVTAHGFGLNFSAATGGGGATDHTSGGTIQNGAGGSMPDTTALIESDSDDAVRLGSNQTLTNYGRILGAGPVDDSASNNGFKPGGSTTNRYDSSHGVEINSGSHDTVDNYGRIEGAQHGVDAGSTADSDITVVNEVGGVIIGHNGSGVGSDGLTANAANATDVTVTNSGAIFGEYRPTYDRSGAATTDGDGDGVDVDGAATITNNAGATIAGAGANEVLAGPGAGGFDSNGRANHSEGLSLGGGVVENRGLISGADFGITVNNDSNANRSGVADTQITNEAGASIVGQNGYAIRLENKGSDGLDTDTIVNHGAITGGGAIPPATGMATLEGGGADMNTVGALNGVAYAASDPNSNRFVLGDGAAIQMGEGNDTLTNDGAIVGTDGRAISLEGGDDTLNLYAEGTVTGGIDGGAGSDTLNLMAHTATTARSLSGVTNFEMLHVQQGVWTLTDTETFSGGATISAGASLQEGVGQSVGGVVGPLVDNGALIVDRADVVTLDSTVTGSGSLSQIGSGVTSLTAAHGFSGVALGAGVLDVAAAGGAGAGAITFAGTLAAPATLQVETAALTGGDFANVLKGFAGGDALDVRGVGAAATATLGANNVLTVAGPGGTETFHLDPAKSYAGETFQAVSDGADGVKVSLAQLTIGAIQGASQSSPLAGETISTQGVVTAINGSSGYYIQSETGHGDNNPNTSDAVYVFGAAPASVHVGDLLNVAGTVTEYQPSSGSTTANNLTTTEITGANIVDLGGGHSVDVTLIGADGREPPNALVASANYATYDPTKYAADFWESVEGMKVTVENAQAVDGTFSNETYVVPDNGAHSLALNARGGVTITPDANSVSGADYAPERIEVYQPSTSPLLPGVSLAYNQGDHLGNVTGVVSYYGGDYELLPTQAPANTTSAGPPADDVTALHSGPNQLTVGAYNVDNLGPIGSAGNPDDTAAKYAALGHDIAYNLGAPAILGLEEIQDSDGEGTGSDLTATVTLNQVTSAISAAGGPTYSYVEVAPTVTNENGGAPNGNIRSAFIYDTSRVSLVAGSVRLIDDPSNPVMNSDGTFNTNGTFYHSREPLAADFTFNGQTVTVIDVHQYSRLGSDELFGKDQPPIVGGDARRTEQADAVLHYVQGLEQANPNAQIVVEGDFNGFYFERALTDLGQTNPATGQPTLVNLVQTLSPAERYSYNFEGDSEQLDNLLVTPNLAGGALFDDVHVNTGQLNLAANSSDGSGAVSDHDPILAQLTIGSAPVSPPGGGGGGTPAPTGITQTGGSTSGQLTGSSGGDSLTAGSAGDTLLGGDGADTLSTGSGHDLLFGNMGDDHIVVGPASLGATVFGGQGDDVVDGSRSNAPNFVSGDLGNDTIVSGAGFETVLGGQGDDSLVGGATAGPGSMQILLGNQGNDHLSYGGSGGVELFGGQDSDTIALTATQAGQLRYAFGNLGSDTLTATGGADSLYGGQGDDVVSAANDPVGHNYLSGDLGDDVVVASLGGSDTLHGGQGADVLTLTAHTAANGDTVIVGAGDSTSNAATDESNVQHIAGFTSGSDHIVLAGHAALSVGAGGNLTLHQGGAYASEAAAFSAAYTYAYGDGGANPAHVGATEYLAVQESYGSASVAYLFTADHHVLALSNVAASGLQSGDVLGG